MQIKEAGHVYELAIRNDVTLESDIIEAPNLLVFVNKERGKGHPGTTTQEVIRALIDRTRYCNNCLPHPNNERIVHHLRMALVLHEGRALERKTEKGEIGPEGIMVGQDGHYQLQPEQVSDNATVNLIPYVPDHKKPPNHG